MPAKPPGPTPLRLTHEDLARADAVRAAMARAAGLDDENGVSRHQSLVVAVRLGLEALERKHGITPKPKK